MSLAALPLALASCGERAATEPPLNATTPSSALPVSGQAVFAVEPTPMSVPTYDGSGQSVHPDIVAFDQPWHGARYWLTMTPYPNSDQTLENPSILTSNDGKTVEVPDGLRNPIVREPHKTTDYNSDPELLYEAQTDRLVLFYRLVANGRNTIRVSASVDGLSWSKTRAPVWEASHRAVSPTIAPRVGAPSRMWYVNAGKAGCGTRSSSVVTRSAADQTGLIVDTRWEPEEQTDLAIPGYVIWHIKARWIAPKSEYWMLISAFPEHRNGCHTDDLFFARSADGVHWKTYQQPIVRHSDREWTAAAVYRSSFLYDAATDELRLWISARGADGVWSLGYARARYAALQSALEAGRGILPRVSPAKPFQVTLGGEQP